MAAPQWSGGKCKSVQHAKAFFRHNDKDRRKETQHTNPHIDKAKTHLNYSYRGWTYQQRCRAFDARMGEIDLGRPSSGKNARTVMQSVIVYPPAGLVADKTRLREWFMKAGAVAEARFGKNMIDMVVDVDEVHQYRDTDGQLRTSLEHGHLWLVPEVDGKLNGKQFSSRGRIMSFNDELQEMSIREFGVPMMDGSKKKGGKTVEQLKARSEAEAIRQEARVEAEAIKIAAEAHIKAQERVLASEVAQATETKNRLENALKMASAGMEYLRDLETFASGQKRRDGKTLLEVFQERRQDQGKPQMNANTAQAAIDAARRAAEAVEERKRLDQLQRGPGKTL